MTSMPVVYKEDDYEIAVADDNTYIVWKYNPDAYYDYGKVWFYLGRTPTLDSGLQIISNNKSMER